MKVMLCLVVLVLGACAGAPPPEKHVYLLPPPVAQTSEVTGAGVRLRPVVVASYLDQKGIVLQVSGAEVRTARQHLWAEPLAEALGRYLQVGIANATGRPVEVGPLTTDTAGTDIRVRIHRLHGSEDGKVELVAEWSVTDAEGVRNLHEIDISRRQSANGYPALVRTHTELLDELVLAVARTLE